MKRKRIVRKLVQIVTFCAFVLLVQSMATVGAVYFLEPFDYCYNSDEQVQNNGLSKAETKANYYDIKMNILNNDNDMTLQYSEYDDGTQSVIGKMQKMVQDTYRIMTICFVVCLFAAIYWAVERRYTFLKLLTMVSLFVPLIGMLGMLLVDKDLFIGLAMSVVSSKYATLFGEQSAVLSVLPKGIITCHYLVYLGIWAMMTASVYVIYRTKHRHRMPHEF